MKTVHLTACFIYVSLEWSRRPVAESYSVIHNVRVPHRKRPPERRNVGLEDQSLLFGTLGRVRSSLTPTAVN